MTKIKICGLKRTEDISYVNELLPDFAGFVFAKSSRQVDAKKAAELKIKVQDLDVKIVTGTAFAKDQSSRCFRQCRTGIYRQIISKTNY